MIKVLAIDDNPDDLIIIKALIRNSFHDIQVLLATSGKDGIALATVEDPDVILLDIVMPEIDGFTICKMLKEDALLHDIPVVFVAALEIDKANRIRAHEAGGEGFISKPIDATELAAQLKAMIKIKAAHRHERNEMLRLETLVAERTHELRKELEERKLAEIQIIRNNERLESLTAILQHEANSVQEFLDYSLNEAIHLTESKIGYIYFYNEEKKEFTLNSWSKDVMLDCTIDNQQQLYSLEKTGIWGEAVRQRKPIVLNDFTKDNPYIKGFPPGHIQLKNFLTVPVIYDKRIVAVIGVANKETDYDQSDILQLRLLMDAVWKTTSRMQTEMAFRESEEKHRAIFECSRDAIMLFDPVSFHFLSGNPATLEMFRIENATLATMSPSDLSPERQPDGRMSKEKSTEMLEIAMRNGSNFFEWNHRRSNGEIFPATVLLNKVEFRGKAFIQSTIRDITLQRKVEQDYQTLFREMLDGFAVHEIICDKQGKPIDYRFLAVNPAFEKMTGLKARNIINKSVLDVMPATESHWIEIYGRVALTGEPAYFENYANELDKHFKVTAFRNAPDQFACIFSDVTARKKAEKTLAESELKYRILANSGQGLIWTSDIDKLCDYFNEPWLRFTGRTLTQELGNGWAEGVHPEDFEQCLQTYVTAFDKLECFSMEYRLRHASGEYRWIQDNGTPRFDINGNFLGYIGHCLDITERKKSEQNLKASEERFRTIFEQAPLGVALIDSLSGHIFEVNSKFAEIAGRTREEMIRIDWMSITHPDDVPRDLENKALMNAGKIPGFSMEKRFVLPDGSHVWISMTVASISVDDKSKPRHLCMIEDITEMRTMEAKLRQSEKMEAIGQLAGGIAHDFNNILSGIIGYVEISIRLTEKDSVLKNNLQKVLMASDRAKHLVQQILTFSRQGKQQKSIIAIVPIVKEVLELLRATIPASVIIESDLQTNIKPVLADPTKIHELILNLATNAVYSMERKGTLTVRLYTNAIKTEVPGRTGKIKPGEYVIIEVTDTGCGMSPETLQKIFDPFFTTKPVGEGTGMGLSVALGVVQSHGGDMQVESTINRGSTFRIFLPATTTVEPEISLIDTPPKNITGTEKVLYVDDEVILVELAQELLSGHGYTVVGMSNSLDALEYIKGNSSEIDLLITDQTMSIMTGVELAKAARQIRHDLPVILCTGYSAEISPERAAVMGISKMMMKPVRHRELMSAVREVLDNQIKR